MDNAATPQWWQLRPTGQQARDYRRALLWRDDTPVADLRRWARETPDATAITAHRADRGAQHLTYREYAEQVERFAIVLRDLGVRSGQVVAIQLPNWWQVNALTLACARLGATVAPMPTTIGPREVELVLFRLAATVCVVPDTWAGFDHSAALATMAPRLPRLRHRLVLGTRVEPDEVDLAVLVDQVDVDAVPIDGSAEDPDRVSLVMFTSGTSGEPKAALHTFNTFFGGYAPTSAHQGYTSADVLCTPHPVTHGVGQILSEMLPLYLGARTLMVDTWDPDAMLTLMADNAVTMIGCAPVFVEQLVRAARRRSEKLPALRRVVAGATAIPSQLVSLVAEQWGVTMQAGWGMTEVNGATSTSPEDDPPDWAAHSDGRPHEGLEIDLRADGEISVATPAAMFVRGACVCLATMGRDSGAPVLLAEHDDGWYDTGDLVVPDGRGGIRLIGRAADRIGGMRMIPVGDVEDALRRHPAITDVAVVGYGNDDELACAVVVTEAALTLQDVRSFLDGLGMTDWYQPSRLEVVETLPRNPTGKVRKAELRQRLSSGDSAA